MSLVPMRELLRDAQRGSYAVCYCEAWNLESFQGIVEAAEEYHAPMITGFNGGFLGFAGRQRPERLEYYAGFSKPLVCANIPAAFLLNETDDFDQIERGIELGFNSVMVENEHLNLKEYAELAKRVVRLARNKGVCVEAAVGRLANAGDHMDAELTDPATARAFVEETGIDALGVAVGNVHILTKGKATIDLARLEDIHVQVKIPLVLHGGTGISLEEMQSYVRLGVAKINFGTNLKQAYLAAVKEKIATYEAPMSPHPFVGLGGPEDILVAGRDAVKAKVENLIRMCGATGKTGSLPEGNTQRDYDP